MENVKLNVKDKSVHTFLSENLLGYKPSERRDMSGDENPYYLIKDEMYFKKSSGLNVGDSVKYDWMVSSIMQDGTITTPTERKKQSVVINNAEVPVLEVG